MLDIPGIVYVVGISDETISKLISSEYQKAAIRGEDYIKKIIQIPMKIPIWAPNDIYDLLKNNVIPEFGSNIPQFLTGKDKGEFDENNLQIISRSVDSNPRELKRFINNLIIAFQIFGRKEGVKEDTLLAIEALRNRWPKFFKNFSQSTTTRNLVWRFQTLDETERHKEIKKKKEEIGDTLSTEYQTVESMPPDLWRFLDFVKDKIDSLDEKGWEPYVSVTASIEKMTSTIGKTSLSPEKIEKLYNQGWDKEKKGDYEGAIEIYNKVLEFNPGHFNSLFGKGTCFHRLGKFEEALRNYESVIALDPNNVTTIYNVSDVHANMGNYEQALDWCDKALAIDPEYFLALHNKGFAYQSLGDYNEALLWYDKALAINPTFVTTLNNKALIYNKLEDYKEALKWADKALEVDPTSVWTLNFKAYHYLNSKDYKEALKWADKTLEVDPNYAPALYNKACLAGYQRKKEEVLKFLKKAISLYPEHRKMAKKDDAFSNYLDDEDFKRIVNE